jgi:UDP:flavonoid glycosyltransferase YjiC (YdhE family)
MDSFLDDPAVEAANGMAYTGAMMRETANKIDEMTEEVKALQVDGIIFDSATRWGKMIGLRLGLPMIARSAMYPPLYQFNRTQQIKKQLLVDAIRSPKSFIHIGQAVTKLIFEHKPKDYDELYTRLYNDNDIKTCTAVPHCLFEPNEIQHLHTYQHHGVAVDEHSEDDPEWTWLQNEERIIVYVSLGTLISIDQEILDTLEKVSNNKILFVVAT